MLATAEDVGIFLRALNDGSVFDKGEQAIKALFIPYQLPFQRPIFGDVNVPGRS